MEILQLLIRQIWQPGKSGRWIIGALGENQIVKHNTKSILKTWFFLKNLEENLLTEFLKVPNWYTINFVSDYYRNFAISENFKLVPTTEDALLTKAGVDQISKISKILKDGVRILAKPISDPCNLSMVLRSFLDACQIVKLQSLFNPSTYRPLSLLLLLFKAFERIDVDQKNYSLSL